MSGLASPSNLSTDEAKFKPPEREAKRERASPKDEASSADADADTGGAVAVVFWRDGWRDLVMG